MKYINILVLISFLFSIGCSTGSDVKRYNNAIDKARRGNYLDAIVDLEAMTKKKPDDAEAHDLLGVCYDQTGRVDDAISEFKTALKLDPTNSKYSNHLGVVYVVAGLNDLAHTQFLYTIKFDPENTNAYYYIGKLNWKEGKKTDAVEAWEKCLEIDPTHLPAAEALDKAKSAMSKSK
jgi:cytochrome c-type biogenesis protein CcmH/NrfG